MRVTFIQPYYHNIWESVGIGYIISYCSANYKGKLSFNFVSGNFDPELNIIESALKSDIVAFSCTTPTYKNVEQLATLIRKSNKNIHMVIGGWHPTVAKGLVDDNLFDQIVIGEGEKAFLDILNGNRDKIIYGKKSTFDELPWPDRKKIRFSRNMKLCSKMSGQRIGSLQSIRGCKMNCAMCAESLMSGKYHKKTNPLRIRSPEDTIDEIEYLHKVYSIDRFQFLDPTWSISEDHVISFCEEKMRRKNTLPWNAMVHAGLITENGVKHMAKANCAVMMVGCESGNARILKGIRKGITIDSIRRVFEWGRKYNIQRRAFFMIGFPNETEKSIKATLKLAKEIDPDIFGVTILAPYPGTDFYDPYKFKNVDWSLVDEYSNDFWETENFTNKELKEIQAMLAENFSDKLAWHMEYILERRAGE